MKTLIIAVLIFLIALTIWLASPVAAARGCREREMFRVALKEKYHEVPDKIAIAGTAVVELFLSPKRSWTILVTGPTGVTCIIASGHNWTDAPVKIEGRDT